MKETPPDSNEKEDDAPKGTSNVATTRRVDYGIVADTNRGGRLAIVCRA